MMKNFKLKFSTYMQNISRSKSFGKFVLIVKATSKIFWLHSDKASEDEAGKACNCSVSP